MRAAEVRRLAHQARVGPGVPVLDLCCGLADPGRMITAESGCRYVGVDQSASALATARQLAGELPTAELITAHQLWNDWLGSGRVRKFAMVAEKQ